LKTTHLEKWCDPTHQK